MTSFAPNIPPQQHTFNKWMTVVPVKYDWLKGEPHIDDMLTDPIVHLVMRRDGLGPSDVRAALDQARTTLRGERQPTRGAA